MPRKTWTRDEYARLFDSGWLGSTASSAARYELLEGEIVTVMPQKRRHLVACMRVQALLMGVFGTEFVQSQGPVALDDNNLPEPDVVVLHRPVSDYTGDPAARDVRLLVEVSDTTLRTDVSVKAALYARAGVVEYWVLDLNGRELRVYSQPTPNGYANLATFEETDTVSLAAAQSVLRVSDMLLPA